MFKVSAKFSRNILRVSCQLSGGKEIQGKASLKAIKPDKAKITLIPHSQGYKDNDRNNENRAEKEKSERFFQISRANNRNDRSKAIGEYNFKKERNLSTTDPGLS